MKKRRVLAAMGTATAVLAGLLGFVRAPATQIPPLDWQPGGAATVGLAPYPSSMRPAPSLPKSALPDFHAGKALANQPWVKAPTITAARDGLGPLYNVRSCLACHTNGGKGRLPRDGDVLSSAVLKLSRPGVDRRHGVVPHPVYGDQLQVQSVSLADQLGLDPADLGAGAELEAPAEAKVRIRWRSEVFAYPDGSEVTLRIPEPLIENLAYGPLGEDALLSLRLAPVIHGAGLLGLIPEAAIDALADPEDRNGDGISGRKNTVWSRDAQRTVSGRFGWKAGQPDLRHTVAAAFANDLGISTPLFPAGPCTSAQTRCLAMASGADEPSGVELPGHLLDLVTDFTTNLAVPAARPLGAEQHAAGVALFDASGCAACHQPQFKTAASPTSPHLGGETIWPYSDLLLHDMGEGLADGRAEFGASGREWRTAPLWGAGIAQRVNGAQHFLHDGRAASIEEAVLWHGGEAEIARDRFVRLPRVQRALLLSFVASL